jgi:Flp pilus assembly protein TadD
VALAQRRRMPWIAAGWIWYLVTLAPVSGVVQVGSQAYADRYAYVPLVGVFAAIAWTADRTLDGRSRSVRWLAGGLGTACLAALFVVTRGQLAYWKDGMALFQRAVTIVPDSGVALNNLGMAHVERGRIAEALPLFRRAVEVAPWDTEARSNLGSALTVLGRPREAVTEFEAALALAPDDASIRFNLAKALDVLGQTDDAVRRLEEAMRVDPGYARAPFYLGIIRLRQRRVEEGIDLLRRAAALDPASPEIRRALEAARRGRS